MSDRIFWLEQSVDVFFSSCNWLGRPLELETHLPVRSTFSLTATVSDFFRSISWEGIPEVGAMPVSQSVPVTPPSAPNSDVTLDDLFDLF